MSNHQEQHNALLNRALNRHVELFGFTGRIPIGWDKKLQRFTYTSKISSLWLWYINSILFIAFMFLFGPIWLILRPKLFNWIPADPSTSISILNYVVFLALGFDAGFCTTANIAQILYGRDVVRGLNALIEMHDHYEKYTVQLQIDSLPIHTPTAKKRTQKFSIFSFDSGMKLIVENFLTYVIVLPIGIIVYKLDPLYFLIRDYLGLNLANETLILLLRTISTIIFILETCKIYPLVFIIFLSGLRLYYCNLNILIQLSTQNNPMKVMRMISAYQIFFMNVKLGSKFQELLTSSLMGVGLILSILFNFAMVKGFALIPFYMYWYVATAAVIIWIIIHFLMYYPYHVTDSSIKLLKILRIRAVHCENQGWRKYYRRKLKSAKIIRVYAGLGDTIFFCLKRSTKVIFFLTIVTHTINLFLGIPPHILEEIIQS